MPAGIGELLMSNGQQAWLMALFVHSEFCSHLVLSSVNSRGDLVLGSLDDAHALPEVVQKTLNAAVAHMQYNTLAALAGCTTLSMSRSCSQAQGFFRS